jgi:hypothetical protein
MSTIVEERRAEQLREASTQEPGTASHTSCMAWI